MMWFVILYFLLGSLVAGNACVNIYQEDKMVKRFDITILFVILTMGWPIYIYFREKDRNE